MGNSKVDTKALDQSNNKDTEMTDATAATYAVQYAESRLVDLIQLFGTTSYQAENVARQFCQSADFLKTYKNKYVLDQIDAVNEAEENKKRGVANAQSLLEQAKQKKDRAELEYNDLVIYEKAAKQSYKQIVGRKYEPLPPKQTAAIKPLSAAARLQIQIQEQARVAADLKKNK
tara:strand:- start:216 stop:737 length:522 start_codon:yes stop_codon:yes gene_type:complete